MVYINTFEAMFGFSSTKKSQVSMQDDQPRYQPMNPIIEEGSKFENFMSAPDLANIVYDYDSFCLLYASIGGFHVVPERMFSLKFLKQV